MHLSIIIPSNRASLVAYSRIMQACSWASEDVEVVVRDNSGDAQKRELLGRVDQPNCRVIFADPCDADTNFVQSLLASTGDFVLFVGDDDSCFDRGIAAMSSAAGRCADDPSVAGLTGAYALEETHVSRIVSYPDLDSVDIVKRVDGFLGYQGPNLIFYSAVRRQLTLDTFQFMAGHPFQLPFHDNLYSLIYLLSGKFIHVGRLTVIYDNTNWDAAEVGVQNDLKFYLAAGMDPIIRQLHWFLCGFEGASLILFSRFGAQHPLAQRQAMASKWFELMFRRFAEDAQNSFGSDLALPASLVREKLLRGFPNFTLEAVLDDLCEFIRLFSPEKAELYHDFWKSIFVPTQP
jgi:hypothetical protein